MFLETLKYGVWGIIHVRNIQRMIKYSRNSTFVYKYYDVSPTKAVYTKRSFSGLGYLR